MKILEIIKSKIDKTIKYIFQLDDGLIAETSYIDNGTGKDILCVPSQTGCIMGCRFCHLADVKDRVKTRNLKYEEIIEMVEKPYCLLDLRTKNRLLLISFMGCGEPLYNIENIMRSMEQISFHYSPCRFAIATMLPNAIWHNFYDLVDEIKNYRINIKIHLSLHFTNDEARNAWMPMAMSISPAIASLEFYREFTGNSVEVHYALIEGVNDSQNDAKKLVSLLQNRDIPVKLLKYNEKETLEYKASEKIKEFMDILSAGGIKNNEYYVPPGISIGASCGQFLLDYYLKYNQIALNK